MENPYDINPVKSYIDLYYISVLCNIIYILYILYIYSIYNIHSHYIIISYTKSYYTNHPSFYHQLRHKPDPLRLWQLKDQFPQRQRGDQRNDEDSYAEDVDTTAYNCIQHHTTMENIA